MYAKLQNFIQLCLTLTELCHIKCDHLMNFYISLRNAKIAISLQQYDLPAQNSAGWCTNVSVKCTAFKISTLKIRNGGQLPSKSRKIAISHYAERVRQAFRPSAILDFLKLHF